MHRVISSPFIPSLAEISQDHMLEGLSSSELTKAAAGTFPFTASPRKKNQLSSSFPPKAIAGWGGCSVDVHMDHVSLKILFVKE